ncbi:MAG: MraY family glycosyltransferase [Candidatus Omnitrophota bacterium]
MYTSWDIAGSLFVGFIVAFGFTPFIRKIAVKLNILDHPEKKKAHLRPTPLLGGVAIFLAFLVCMVLVVDMTRVLFGIFISVTMLLVLGLVDDKMGMLPQLKLCVQTLAAIVVYKFGLHVTTIEDYYLSMVFTVFWIVGITNAFNLLDNLNGLSSGIAAIASFFFCVITFVKGDYLAAAFAAGIMGACLGFLKYNFPKAHIFMGDSGSLVLGFLLACLAVIGSWETEKVSLSLAIPIVILGYPIFDTTLVTIIRLREGRSIFQGGRDHSSHMLASIGFKKKNAVLLIFTVCFLLGISALVIQFAPYRWAFAALIVTASSMAGFCLRLMHVRNKMVNMRNAKTSVRRGNGS